MRALLTLGLLVFAAPAQGQANKLYSLMYDTTNGTATLSVSGGLQVRHSSSSYTTKLLEVDTHYGINIATGVTVIGSSLTITGAGGFLKTSSSITASAFFGDGANITGVSAAAPATFTSSETFNVDVLMKARLTMSG